MPAFKSNNKKVKQKKISRRIRIPLGVAIAHSRSLLYANSLPLNSYCGKCVEQVALKVQRFFYSEI